MGTADNRARADTGRLRSALAVPAVERNRDKCRSQLLQAVGGYRCDIYGNHVSLRLHPLFPITNASPVCAVRRASVHYLPGEGELDECAFVIAPYSKHGTWLFNDERRNLVEEPLVAAAPETIAEIVADIPNAKAGFRLTFLQGLFHLLRRTAAVALRIAEIPASASLARDDRTILRCLYSPAGSPPSDPQATPTAGQTLGTLCCALHVFRKAPSNRHPTHVFR